MPGATQTLNPLPFEHLEPRRFEDLVRQLAYDFRPWRQLEALGRSGADEGFDARGWEIITSDDQGEQNEDPESGEEIPLPTRDRQWLIQCKRETSIGPKKLAAYAEDVPEASALYGVIFAAPATLSKKARDNFRAKCAARGVQEVIIWGRGELEDIVLQPKNDHLLFAYFGISLVIRRRSIRTEIRSRLATKRKAHRLLDDRMYRPVLVRDPRALQYPDMGNAVQFEKSPQWIVRQFLGFDHAGLKIMLRRHFAFLSDDGKQWDAAFKVNDARLSRYEDQWMGREEHAAERAEIMKAWDAFPEKNRAWLEDYGVIRYEDVLDIDQFGDEFVEAPHVFAEFNGFRGPFTTFYAIVETVGYGKRSRWLTDEEEDRIKVFAKQFRKRLVT